MASLLFSMQEINFINLFSLFLLSFYYYLSFKDLLFFLQLINLNSNYMTCLPIDISVNFFNNILLSLCICAYFTNYFTTTSELHVALFFFV